MCSVPLHWKHFQESDSYKASTIWSWSTWNSTSNNNTNINSTTKSEVLQVTAPWASHDVWNKNPTSTFSKFRVTLTFRGPTRDYCIISKFLESPIDTILWGTKLLHWNPGAFQSRVCHVQTPALYPQSLTRQNLLQLFTRGFETQYSGRDVSYFHHFRFLCFPSHI